MDRLVELKKQRRGRPAVRARDLREERAAAQPAGRARTPPRSRGSRPGPTWRRTTRSSPRPSSGAGSPWASRIDDVAEYLNLTALFRNQWGFRPENGENDTEFKDRVKATLRERAGQGQGGRPAGAVGGLRALRRQRRGQRPRHLEGRVAVVGVDALHLPAPAQGAVAVHRGLLPPDRARATRTSPASCCAPSAPGPRRRRPGSSPRTSTRTTSSCTASASRWPRPRPSTGTAGSARSSGSPTRTGPRLTGLFRQQYRGGRYSWGYPACPDLTDNAKVVELLGGDRIGVTVSEGFQLNPEQTTDAIICHHPEAKYFVA